MALACIGTPEITENLMELFCGVLDCREMSVRGKVDFWNSCEGVSRGLWTLFESPLSSLRNKILEESEENLQKSE